MFSLPESYVSPTVTYISNRSSFRTCSQESDTKVKTMRDKSEPAIEIVPDMQTSLILLAAVVCDYSLYECSDLEVQFSDTPAFEVFSNRYKTSYKLISPF